MTVDEIDNPPSRARLGEAAFLAGLPKASNRYSPRRHPQAAEARRDWVLSFKKPWKGSEV